MTVLKAKGSIRRTLIIQLASVAAILSVAFFLLVREIAGQAAEETQDNILAASAVSIADALYSERDQVTLELPYSAISMLGGISQDRVFYRVTVDGETLTGYDDLPEAAASATRSLFATFPYRGETVRAVTTYRAISVGNMPRDVRITVAQTQLGLALISSRITASATAIAVGFFLVATALSLFAARSALRPINRLTETVTRRGPGDLRPVTDETPAELLPLVEALNSFVSRLRVSLARSEEFIAEAAHRVRTPLATVRAQAEITHRRLNKPEHRQAIRGMIRAIDESSRSTGQLLDHAMVTFRADSPKSTALDLVDLLGETCDRLDPTADLKDIDILRDLPAYPVPFSGDRVLLQSALGNVLDNAIKYSSEDGQIDVTMTTGAEITITVRDQGRGFVGDHFENLTQRFSRGPNVSDIVGSGLGLTIADEVVRSHGGKLIITNNTTGGGACVSLILPLV